MICLVLRTGVPAGPTVVVVRRQIHAHAITMIRLGRYACALAVIADEVFRASGIVATRLLKKAACASTTTAAAARARGRRAAGRPFIAATRGETDREKRQCDPYATRIDHCKFSLCGSFKKVRLRNHSQRTHRTRCNSVASPPEVLPPLNQTSHRTDVPSMGDDVHHSSLVPSRNAAVSMAGAIRVSSTIVCNSFILGRRQPLPSRTRFAQCACASAHVNVLGETCSQVRFVFVSCTVPFAMV